MIGVYFLDYSTCEHILRLIFRCDQGNAKVVFDNKYQAFDIHKFVTEYCSKQYEDYVIQPLEDQILNIKKCDGDFCV